MCSSEVSKCLAEYTPFVSALKSNQKSFRCDFCFKSLKERVECSVCHNYWYCNDLCLNNDLMCHRFECDSNFDLIQMIKNKCSAPEVTEESDWSKFKDLDEFVTQTLLLLRILFKMKSDPNCATNAYPLGNGMSVSYDQITVPISRTMHRIWDESKDEESFIKSALIDDISYNFSAWLSVINNVLDSDFLKSKLGSIPEEILMKAFRVVVRYTLYVSDMYFLNEIGKAFYVEMCFISHSCLPNCGPLFQDSNVLNLRSLTDGITDFSQLKYDFQIEMTAYSASELSDSLQIRSIDCQCNKCLNINQFNVNYHKNLTDANLKYGNLPPIDYCIAMSAPIDDAIDYMTQIHGNNHPFITGLLLWKLRNEWFLFKSEESKDTITAQLLDTFKDLKKAVLVTHGSDHIWSIKMNSIEKLFIRSLQSTDEFDLNFQIIDQTIDQIIPKSVIDQKLA